VRQSLLHPGQSARGRSGLHSFHWQSDNHAEYIAKCKKGVFKYRKIERPTENIQVYGDAAVVTGHTKMEVMVDGKPKLLNSRYTNVWVKGAKGWQMVVWPSTPIPA
jgi:ketosteroid isomerase-like protein